MFIIIYNHVCVSRVPGGLSVVLTFYFLSFLFDLTTIYLSSERLLMFLYCRRWFNVSVVGRYIIYYYCICTHCTTEKFQSAMKSIVSFCFFLDCFCCYCF